LSFIYNYTETKQPLSKNQLKKLKREQEWEQKKQSYKQHKKQEKKLNKQKKKEEEENLKKENPDLYNKLYKSEIILNPPKKESQKKYLNNLKKGIIVIIDCGFEKFMNDKDIISLTRQITDCYSTNKKAERPFNLIIYDVGEKLKKNLLKNNCEKWIGFRFIEEGKYENIKEFLTKDLYNYAMNINQNDYSENNLSLDSDNLNQEEYKHCYKFEEIVKGENIIYLTGDSENEIDNLEQNKVYIIGGLVDRNKLKLITYNKANEMGISHAKLPIGDFINLKTSKILATNHVFSILAYYTNKKADWKESFTSIIPKRKMKEDLENKEQTAD